MSSTQRPSFREALHEAQTHCVAGMPETLPKTDALALDLARQATLDQCRAEVRAVLDDTVKRHEAAGCWIVGALFCAVVCICSGVAAWALWAAHRAAQ